jgi:hypothetical protein
MDWLHLAQDRDRLGSGECDSEPSGISWLAEDLLVPQEGLWCVELAS